MLSRSLALVACLAAAVWAAACPQWTPPVQLLSIFPTEEWAFYHTSLAISGCGLDLIDMALTRVFVGEVECMKPQYLAVSPPTNTTGKGHSTQELDDDYSARSAITCTLPPTGRTLFEQDVGVLTMTWTGTPLTLVLPRAYSSLSPNPAILIPSVIPFGSVDYPALLRVYTLRQNRRYHASACLTPTTDPWEPVYASRIIDAAPTAMTIALPELPAHLEPGLCNFALYEVYEGLSAGEVEGLKQQYERRVQSRRLIKAANSSEGVGSFDPEDLVGKVYVGPPPGFATPTPSDSEGKAPAPSPASRESVYIALAFRMSFLMYAHPVPADAAVITGVSPPWFTGPRYAPTAASPTSSSPTSSSPTSSSPNSINPATGSPATSISTVIPSTPSPSLSARPVILTIEGHALLPAVVRVTVNGLPCPGLTGTATAIRCTLPACPSATGAPCQGEGLVTLYNAKGYALDSSIFLFAPPAFVTGIFPSEAVPAEEEQSMFIEAQLPVGVPIYARVGPLPGMHAPNQPVSAAAAAAHAAAIAAGAVVGGVDVPITLRTEDGFYIRIPPCSITKDLSDLNATASRPSSTSKSSSAERSSAESSSGDADPVSCIDGSGPISLYPAPPSSGTKDSPVLPFAVSHSSINRYASMVPPSLTVPTASIPAFLEIGDRGLVRLWAVGAAGLANAVRGVFPGALSTGGDAVVTFVGAPKDGFVYVRVGNCSETQDDDYQREDTDSLDDYVEESTSFTSPAAMSSSSSSSSGNSNSDLSYRSITEPDGTLRLLFRHTPRGSTSTGKGKDKGRGVREFNPTCSEGSYPIYLYDAHGERVSYDAEVRFPLLVNPHPGVLVSIAFTGTRPVGEAAEGFVLAVVRAVADSANCPVARIYSAALEKDAFIVDIIIAPLHRNKKPSPLALAHVVLADVGNPDSVLRHRFPSVDPVPITPVAAPRCADGGYARDCDASPEPPRQRGIQHWVYYLVVAAAVFSGVVVAAVCCWGRRRRARCCVGSGSGSDKEASLLGSATGSSASSATAAAAAAAAAAAGLGGDNARLSINGTAPGAAVATAAPGAKPLLLARVPSGPAAAAGNTTAVAATATAAVAAAAAGGATTAGAAAAAAAGNKAGECAGLTASSPMAPSHAPRGGWLEATPPLEAFFCPPPPAGGESGCSGGSGGSGHHSPLLLVAGSVGALPLPLAGGAGGRGRRGRSTGAAGRGGGQGMGHPTGTDAHTQARGTHHAHVHTRPLVNQHIHVHGHELGHGHGHEHGHGHGHGHDDDLSLSMMGIGLGFTAPATARAPLADMADGSMSAGSSIGPGLGAGLAAGMGMGMGIGMNVGVGAPLGAGIGLGAGAGAGVGMGMRGGAPSGITDDSDQEPFAGAGAHDTSSYGDSVRVPGLLGMSQ